MNNKLNYSYLYSYQDGTYTNILKCVDVNFGLFALILVAGFIINYKTEDNIFRTGFTYLAISIWTYYVHKTMHDYPNTVFGKIHAIHHNPLYKDTISAEIFEIFVNIIIIGGLFWIPIILILENQTGIKIANHHTILIWALIFTTYHLINYHVVKHDIHAQHHVENGVNNYGPEWFDILCNTKAEKSEMEDMNSVMINIVVIIFIVLGLKDTPYDLIQILTKLLQ